MRVCNLGVRQGGRVKSDISKEMRRASGSVWVWRGEWGTYLWAEIRKGSHPHPNWPRTGLENFKIQAKRGGGSLQRCKGNRKLLSRRNEAHNLKVIHNSRVIEKGLERHQSETASCPRSFAQWDAFLSFYPPSRHSTSHKMCQKPLQRGRPTFPTWYIFLVISAFILDLSEWAITSGHGTLENFVPA